MVLEGRLMTDMTRPLSLKNVHKCPQPLLQALEGGLRLEQQAVRAVHSTL